jgi:MFS family permease
MSAFTLLLTASTLSNFGDGLRMAALPLVAMHLTSSKFLIAVAISAGRLPWLAAPVAGTLVDRWDRRRVMIGVDAARAGCQTVIGVTLLTGTCTISLLTAGGFVLGVGEVFFDTAAIAMTSALADGKRLHQANAQVISGQTVANQFAGQPLGGAATAVSSALPFLADSASFIASVLLLHRIKGTFRAATATSRRNIRQEMAEGFRYLVRQRTLLIVTCSAGLLGIAGGAVQASLVLLVVGTLRGGPGAFGLILGVGALGSVGGALGSTQILHIVGFRRALACSLAGGSLAYLALGSSPGLVAAGLAFLAVGATVILWNVPTITARQRLAPDNLVGRVQAVYRMIAWGTYPVGALIGGLLAHETGNRTPSYFASAILALLLPLQLLISPKDSTRIATTGRQSRLIAAGRSN